MARNERERFAELKAEPMEDGGDVDVYCEQCDMMLMTIWKTRNLPIQTQVNVSCPYCEHKTSVSVSGGLHFGATDNTRIKHIEHDLISNDKQSANITIRRV
jgi:hypothetical protein